MIIRTLLVAGLALAATPAFAFQCPGMMTEIDAAMAEASGLSEDQKMQVQTLRDEGEELHAAGEHDQSIEKLNEAKEILGL